MIAALALRALPVVAGLAALAILVGAVYHKGYTAGADTERTAAEVRETVRKNAEAAAVARRVIENATLRAAQDRANLEDAQRHEQADLAVQVERDLLRGDVRRAGGLRVPCPQHHGPAAEAHPAADGEPAASTAGTVALPEEIEASLLDLAEQADQVTEQARAMQQRLLEDAGER